MLTRWCAAAIGVLLVAGVLVVPSAVGAHAVTEPVLPPTSFTMSSCAGATPVVVGSDAKAQSDIYSAVTLAGVIGTECLILAGPRDGGMSSDQRSRLDAAAAGGYVVGGTGAVPGAKITGRNMTRIAGADRWATAQQVGSQARMLGGGPGTAAPALDTSLTAPGDVQLPGVHLSGAEPWIGSDCSGDVPIVVGSDAKAQSDIYSAVTLAGVIGTDCVILAGPRDGAMPASQQVRLTVAAAGGFVVGGIGAVSTVKLAGRDMTRLAGSDRWESAQLVGRRASGDTTAGTSTATEPSETMESGGDSQEDEQLIGDDYVPASTESAGGWWARPRGNLIVDVDVCVAQGLEHYFTDSDLMAYAAHYNHVVAPFYAWQSSGLLNVQFEPGQVMVSKVAAEARSLNDWGSHIAPIDCLDKLPRFEPHVAHAMIVYYENETPIHFAGGFGVLGMAGITNVRHKVDEAPSSIILGDWATRVTQHELDHVIGVPHYYAWPLGYNRVLVNSREGPYWAGLDGPPHPSSVYALYSDDGAILGALAEYPVGLQGPRQGRLTRGNFFLYPCYMLRRQGWPVGDGHPACVRMPPAPPEVSIAVGTDGSARITWLASGFDSVYELEPVTGYVIEVTRTSPPGNAVGDVIKAAEGSVSAGSMSYDLRPGTIDLTDYGAEYDVAVTPVSIAGAGPAGLEVFEILPPATQITVEQRPSYGAVDPPIEFELSWTPAPRASSYRICGFRNSGPNTSICDGELTVDGTTFTLSEAQDHISEGESYDITVFACGEAYESESGRVSRFDAPFGCFIYATATIRAEPPESSTTPPLGVEPTSIGTCSWLHPDTGVAVPCSRVTWPLHPNADVYFVRYGCGVEGTTRCPDGGAGTANLEFADGRRVGFDGPDWPEGGWADLSLTPGTRHRVRVFACPKPYDPGRCFEGGDAWLVGETWVTIPESSN